MKILENTHTRLTLKQYPWRSWIAGGGLTIAGIGLFLFATIFSTASIRLLCDRSLSNQVNCDLRRYSLLGISEKVKITNLQGVNIIQKRGSKGGKTYQVILQTASGIVPLLRQNTGGYQNHYQVASQIQNFITSGQRSLSTQQNVGLEQFLFTLFSLAFAGMGLFFITTPVATCTFYKGILSKVIIELNGLRGNTKIERSTHEIQTIDIKERRERWGKKSCRVFLILNDQERLPIHSEFTNQHTIENVVYSIHQFLGNKN